MTTGSTDKGTRKQGNEPQSNSEYLDRQYWDQRFEKEEQYEWFKGFSEFRHLLVPHLKPSDRILVLGCGNSSLTTDLWKEGFHDTTSIDLSEVAVRKMEERAKAAGMSSLQWRVADMQALPFESSCFDVVLEKGTMDVLFVDNDSPWQPKPEVCMRVHQMLGEAHRVLTPEGVLLSVTFAQPHFRRPFLLAPQYTWGMQCASFGETFHYFVYCLKKGARPQSDDVSSNHQHDYRSDKQQMMHEHMDQENYLSCIDL